MSDHLLVKKCEVSGTKFLVSVVYRDNATLGPVMLDIENGKQLPVAMTAKESIALTRAIQDVVNEAVMACGNILDAEERGYPYA